MPRFADEMRGSEGERCTVTDRRVGKTYAGTILKWDDRIKKADVKYDDGRIVQVGFGFVTLEGGEHA